MKIVLMNMLAFFYIILFLNDTNSLKIYNQNKEVSSSNFYSDEQIENFIREVFLNYSDELVFNSNSQRYELIKEFLNNRFKIEYRPEYKGKNFNLLSSVSINNKYNTNLKMDTKIDLVTFNPLKYNFLMNSRTKHIYRVDNTDFIITILPIN